MTLTATKPKLEHFHLDYLTFMDFANRNEWLYVTSVVTNEKGTQTWLTPTGRIIRITRDQRSVLRVE